MECLYVSNSIFAFFAFISCLELSLSKNHNSTLSSSAFVFFYKLPLVCMFDQVHANLFVFMENLILILLLMALMCFGGLQVSFMEFCDYLNMNWLFPSLESHWTDSSIFLLWLFSDVAILKCQWVRPFWCSFLSLLIYSEICLLMFAFVLLNLKDSILEKVMNWRGKKVGGNCAQLYRYLMPAHRLFLEPCGLNGDLIFFHWQGMDYKFLKASCYSAAFIDLNLFFKVVSLK